MHCVPHARVVTIMKWAGLTAIIPAAKTMQNMTERISLVEMRIKHMHKSEGRGTPVVRKT